MLDQLNFAPCGYLIIDQDGTIIEMNVTLKNMLGEREEVGSNHIHALLTTPSRIYFQTYFLPLLDIKGQVNEIYLTLRSQKGKIPVLMNAIEREIEGKKRIECVLMEVKVRDEYEYELIQEKRNAVRIIKETDEANLKLQKLLQEVENKKGELESMNAQLEKLVSTDALTSLSNRRYFDEQLIVCIEDFRQKEKSFVLVLLDIDYFKRINDNFGHQIGDLVLQELSLKLQSVAKEDEIVARIGGEEFAVLYPRTEEATGYQLAEKIRMKIELSEWLHTPVTVSIGVTAVKEHDTYTEIMRRADQALYESKNTGRNRVSLR